VSAVFGEFLAWITVTNLILEYMLANAAVIRWVRALGRPTLY
jgi:hypothetical protein